MPRATGLFVSQSFAAAVAALALVSDSHGQNVGEALTSDTSRYFAPTTSLNGPALNPPRLIGFEPLTDGWITDTAGLPSLVLTFDMPVSAPGNAVRVFDSTGTEIVPFSRTFNLAGDELTLFFSPAITNRRVRVVADYSIAANGLAFDGEIAVPVAPSFPSGDGQQGGQGTILLNVLAGDANCDGVVDGDDAGMIVGSLGLTEGDAGFEPGADFNGDGVVNVLDVATWTMNNGSSLPPTDGVAPTVTLELPDPETGLGPNHDELVVRFSEAMSFATLSPRSATLVDESGDLVEPVGVTVLDTDRVMFELASPLMTDRSYQLSLSNALADLSGELLDPKSSVFMLSPASDVSIFPPRVFPVGFGPRFAISGDLNSDENPDFVVSNTADGTVSVLLGEGDGTFRPQLVFDAGVMPRGLSLADFDGDTRLDLAVALEGENAVRVLFGDGSGGLGLGLNGSVLLEVGMAPVFVDAGELSGDALPDLAVTNHDSGSVSIFFGRADRSLDAGPNVPVGGVPSAAVLGELTGDTLLDLAVTDEASNTLTVYTGLGGGNFDTSARGTSTLPTGLNPIQVGIGDLDNDKDLDLVTANPGGNSISIFLNQRNSGARGSSGFDSMTVPTGTGSTYAGIGDLDNDKDLDVMSANKDGDSLSPVRQGPAGVFMATESQPTGDQPLYVAITDVNGDGVSDVVTVLAREEDEARRGALVVRLGGSEENPEGQIQIPSPASGSLLELADVGGIDGADDLLVSTADFPGVVSIRYSDGNGGFTPGPELTAPSAVRELVVANVIGGPELDVLVRVISKVNEVYVFANNGDGTFQDAQFVANGAHIAVGDLVPRSAGNEIVLSPFGTGGSSITIYNLFELTGRGSLAPVGSLNVGTNFFEAMVVDDVSGEGFPDIVAVGFNGVFSDSPGRGFVAGLAVILTEPDGKGGVSFPSTMRVAIPSDRDYVNIAVGDMTGDDLPDIAVTSNEIIISRGGPLGIVSIFDQASEPMFVPREETLAVGDRVGPVVAKDFNADGLVDLAAASFFDDQVAVFVSAPGGGFFPVQLYETHVGPESIATGDIDDDSATDLAVLNLISDDVTILRGQTPGSEPQGPDAASQLQLNLDAFSVQATPSARGTVFGTSFTGTLTLSQDADTALSGLLVNGIDQGVAGSLMEISAEIQFENGNVTGGAIAVLVLESDGETINAYGTGVLPGVGQISTQAGQGFIVDGITFTGLFSTPTFAGLDVLDWYKEQPLLGSFILFRFDPDGSGLDTDTDMDLFLNEGDPAP